MRQSVVPSFFLYGEPPQPVGDRFLHVENLDYRSRPSGWIIRPHAHVNLNHLFWLTAGGGIMRAESRIFAIMAPAVLIVPAGVVHGFNYRPETTGSVLTIAEPYLDELLRREPDLAPVFAGPACLALEQNHGPGSSIEKLSRELVWAAPGHRAAVDAHLLQVAVDVLRLLHHEEGARAPLGPHALLVARFRTLVEERYRSQADIAAYAAGLKVSLPRLRDACFKVAGATPHQMIQDRLVVEAKRVLIYSSMTISDAAFYLGFNDAAYFSRFFSKATRESPRAFRARHAAS